MVSPEDIDFRAVAAQAPVAWSVIDLDGRQVVGNEVYASMFGYTSEEIASLGVADLTHPDDQALTDDYLQRLVRGEIDRFEIDKKYVRKDGSVFIGHLVASLMRDTTGAPQALVGVITDVTRERELAEQVAQSEERLSKMLTNISETVSLVAPDGTITATTGFHTEILGYPTEFWDDASIFDLVHPDQRQRAEALAAEVLATPRAELRGEFRVRHQLGHYEEVELAAVNLLDDPAVGAVVLTTRNVSERKAQERELVRVRDRALRLAEQRSTFVANVSHELRTPLHAVLGLAELLDQTELTDEQQSFVAGIAAEATRLRETVDDLLDHARVEADGLVLEPDECGLRDLVDAVVRRNAAAEHAQGLDITCQIDDSVPERAVLDEHRVDQVLTNVVGNAVKFTASGSVAVEARAGGHELHVTVEDTGPGIPAELHDQVFQPFTQVPGQSTTTSGSGLGLALVRGLVELMGGSVDFGPRPGGGTVFRLRIPFEPMTEDSSSTGPAAAHALDPTTSGISVLVVEDNPTNQMLVRQQLGRLGHACTIAPDAHDALDRLAPADHGFDVVLMDWQLPDIDGLEATRRLRRLEADRTPVPVIAVTASAMPEDRAACRAAGMDDFLPKPVALADLSAMIDRWAPHPVTDGQGGGAKTDVDRSRLEHLVDDLGDRSVVASLVTSYLSELEVRRGLLADAHRVGDLEVLHRVGHTLRSTSEMLGAERLVRVCRRMEEASDTTDLDALLVSFTGAADETETGLQSWLDSYGEERS